MKFLNQYFGILVGVIMIGYAFNCSLNESGGVGYEGFVGILGFFVIVSSLKYSRFTLPFSNRAVERRRNQRPINPKYDRRTRHYR